MADMGIVDRINAGSSPPIPTDSEGGEDATFPVTYSLTVAKSGPHDGEAEDQTVVIIIAGDAGADDRRFPAIP